MKRLLIIVAFAFAVCVHVGHGQSTIAYFNGPSFQVPMRYGDSTKGIDFDGDGPSEFTFWSNGQLCTMDVPTSGCSWSFYIGASAASALLVSDFAHVQPAGAVIGDSAPAGATWHTTQPYGATLTASWWSLYGRIINEQTVHSGWHGTLGTLTNGYLGVRFQAQDGLHYGWIHVRLPGPATGAEGFPIEFTPVIVDWAYETRPNTAIIAGAKPRVVPLTASEIIRAGNLRLRWPSEISKAYQVQVKESLTAPLWTNLDFVVVGTTTNAAVDIPITGTAKFFRVVEAD